MTDLNQEYANINLEPEKPDDMEEKVFKDIQLIPKIIKTLQQEIDLVKLAVSSHPVHLQMIGQGKLSTF